jgi:N-methylhydantoinase B
MLTDSAGDGQWRGGLGVHVEYLNCHAPKTWRPLDCAVITGNSDGQKFPPHGLFGGTDGKRHELWIQRGARVLPLRTMDTQYVQPGDVIGTMSGGGGGIGDPLNRDIERVAWDVLNGYISLEKARDIYGVVIDPKSSKVNLEATAALRKRLKAPAKGQGRKQQKHS